MKQDYSNPFSAMNGEGFNLAFKTHNIFFNEVEEYINDAKKIGELSIFDPTMLNLYFSKLNMITTYYSAYFDLNKDVFETENGNNKLKEIQKLLFSPDYIDKVSKKKKESNIISLDKSQQKIYDELNEIAKELALQMSYSDLRPRPNRVKKNPIDEFGVKDRATRKVIEGALGFIDNHS